METNYRSEDLLHNDVPAEVPSSLKTLTLLTFIGCGYYYISTLWGLLMPKDTQKQVNEIHEAREKLGDGFMARWMDGSAEMLEKSQQHQWLSVALTLIFTTLCLIGAIKMRKLQRSGFPIYAFGELAPLLVMYALFGFNIVTAVTGGFVAIIAIVFTLLYARQRKYMVRD
jgi:hypothetical protein